METKHVFQPVSFLIVTITSKQEKKSIECSDLSSGAVLSRAVGIYVSSYFEIEAYPAKDKHSNCDM